MNNEDAFSNGALVKERVYQAGDCLTPEIKSRAKLLNIDEILGVVKEVSFSWDDHIEFTSCGNICEVGSEIRCPKPDVFKVSAKYERNYSRRACAKA